MSRLHLPLLPALLISASLLAQDPAPRPGEPTPVLAFEKAPEPPAEKATEWTSERHHWRHHYHAQFGAYAQALWPQREMKEALDGGTGYGLGLQWTHDHGDWNASRTRLEWNTFAEGDSVPPLGTKTYAKNYLLSWDHLFMLNQGHTRAYAVAGVGGARWNLEQTTSGVRTSLWTTKLAITAGLGVRLGERVNIEARYVVSSVQKTYDGSSAQVALGWRF